MIDRWNVFALARMIARQHLPPTPEFPMGFFSLKTQAEIRMMMHSMGLTPLARLSLMRSAPVKKPFSALPDVSPGASEGTSGTPSGSRLGSLLNRGGDDDIPSD